MFCPNFILMISQVSESYLWVRYEKSYKDGFLISLQYMNRKALSSKSLRSDFSNALSIAPIAFPVADISKFEFPKILSFWPFQLKQFHTDEEFLRMSSYIIRFTKGFRI